MILSNNTIPNPFYNTCMHIFSAQVTHKLKQFAITNTHITQTHTPNISVSKRHTHKSMHKNKSRCK